MDHTPHADRTGSPARRAGTPRRFRAPGRSISHLVRQLRQLRRPQVLVAGIVVVALTLTGAGAWAFWATARFAGVGVAKPFTTLSAHTVTAGATTTTLYPGGPGAVLSVVVANSNTIAQPLKSIQLDTIQGTGGYTIDSKHAGNGCTVSAAALTFTPYTPATAITIPASSSGNIVALPASALVMGTTANSACQGATITVYLKTN